MNTAIAQTGKYATVNGLHRYYEIHGSLAIFPGGHGTFMGELTTRVVHKQPVALPVIEDFLNEPNNKS